jgi:hypothetical protein
MIFYVLTLSLGLMFFSFKFSVEFKKQVCGLKGYSFRVLSPVKY